MVRVQRQRIIWGRWLDRVGQLGLPLGLGLIGGYWISDLGVAWTPTMLEILSLVFLGALGLILIGQGLKGKIVRQSEGASVPRKRAVVLMILLLIAASLRLLAYWFEQPSPLTRLDATELQASFAIDTEQTQQLDAELESLLVRLEKEELFTQPDARRGLSDGEERLLRDTWFAFYDNAFALDQIRIFYEDWFHFDPSRAERPQLLQSYLLTFNAELALYEKSLRMVRLILRVPEALKFLDAPHPEHGLPEHTFSVFREEFLGFRDQARVLAGEQYLNFLETTLDARALTKEHGFESLNQLARSRLAKIEGIAPLARAEHTLRGDLQLLKRSVRRTWFPTQKGIAEWIGSVKTRRPGRYLITREQLQEMAQKLEPGDILLGRKNWHLTNVGLPGFWPHAMLYIGDPEKMNHHLDTTEVRAHLRQLTGEDLSFEDYLRKTFPIAWARYQEGKDDDPIEILEAIGEGIVLNSMKGSAGDYLAALRPRLAPLAKAQAILEAFHHLDKPYDYDFDFATDHALVCSELVWRAYRPREGKVGFDLPLVEVAGRLTLPPNNIARLYAEEAKSPDRRLDFVYFLDARESEERSLIADESAFLESHRRLKWDVLQK